jgi:hypothetical protein
MTQTQIYGELRGFAVRDTHDVVTWARAGTLSQNNEVDIPIAVSVAQPGGRPVHRGDVPGTLGERNGNGADLPRQGVRGLGAHRLVVRLSNVVPEPPAHRSRR